MGTPMVTDSTLRLAMWSGPRNISTAMMRAWENRDDTAVLDEPFYGYYLARTDADHPGAKEIIESQGDRWQEVVKRCLAPPPSGKRIYYQKHMTMHLLPEIEHEWLKDLMHCMLIRNPEEVISSYAKVRPNIVLNDIGVVQQTEIFRMIEAVTARPPLVIDSRDVLLHPQKMLTNLCEQFGIPFSDKMLSWPKGARDSDGVWGKYWYKNVWQSTGFAPYNSQQPALSGSHADIAAQAQPYYQELYERRLISSI
jgi:hypothetical protein